MGTSARVRSMVTLAVKKGGVGSVVAGFGRGVARGRGAREAVRDVLASL